MSSHEAEALAWFARAEALDPKGSVGARAAWSSLPLSAEADLKDSRIAKLTAYLQRFPGFTRLLTGQRLAVREGDVQVVALTEVNAALVHVTSFNTLVVPISARRIEVPRLPDPHSVATVIVAQQFISERPGSARLLLTAHQDPPGVLVLDAERVAFRPFIGAQAAS